MRHTLFPNRGERLEALKRFLQKPWPKKMLSIRFACLHVFGAIPLRLPFGGWWLASNDYNGNTILGGHYETAARRFTEKFLRHGMSVLDIGAHHGLYTLLAARKVGVSGR